eukprot:6724664-Prymnesium_polylepis.1
MQRVLLPDDVDSDLAAQAQGDGITKVRTPPPHTLTVASCGGRSFVGVRAAVTYDRPDRTPASLTVPARHDARQALKLSPFAHVLPLDLVEALRRGEGAPVQRIAQLLDLEPKRIMLVSDDRATIGAARTGRAFSCYYAKNIPGRPKKI